MTAALPDLLEFLCDDLFSATLGNSELALGFLEKENLLPDFLGLEAAAASHCEDAASESEFSIFMVGDRSGRDSAAPLLKWKDFISLDFKLQEISLLPRSFLEGLALLPPFEEVFGEETGCVLGDFISVAAGPRRIGDGGGEEEEPGRRIGNSKLELFCSCSCCSMVAALPSSFGFGCSSWSLIRSPGGEPKVRCLGDSCKTR
jgi:hypothetical protein